MQTYGNPPKEAPRWDQPLGSLGPQWDLHNTIMEAMAPLVLSFKGYLKQIDKGRQTYILLRLGEGSYESIGNHAFCILFKSFLCAFWYQAHLQVTMSITGEKATLRLRKTVAKLRARDPPFANKKWTRAIEGPNRGGHGWGPEVAGRWAPSPQKSCHKQKECLYGGSNAWL